MSPIAHILFALFGSGPDRRWSPYPELSTMMVETISRYAHLPCNAELRTARGPQRAFWFSLKSGRSASNLLVLIYRAIVWMG